MSQYFSLNNRVFKSKRIKWLRHRAPTGEMRNAYNIVVGKPKEGDVGLSGSITLNLSRA
jgi:hypothetical protein